MAAINFPYVVTTNTKYSFEIFIDIKRWLWAHIGIRNVDWKLEQWSNSNVISIDTMRLRISFNRREDAIAFSLTFSADPNCLIDTKENDWVDWTRGRLVSCENMGY